MRSVFGIRDDCWMTAKQLGLRNHDEARALRDQIQHYNNNFGQRGQNTYILSGSKGYKLTDNLDEISVEIDKEFRSASRKYDQAALRKYNLHLFQSKGRAKQLCLEDL